MDASGECERRPDLGSYAEWTPVGSLGGVQLEKGSKIGCRVIVRMASRLGRAAGMDASGECGRRPDWGSCAEWTPAVSAEGVQNGEVVRNGRHIIWQVASKT